MTRWEYRVEPVHLATWNGLGRDGWELVIVLNGEAYFKRPIDGRKSPKQLDGSR